MGWELTDVTAKRAALTPDRVAFSELETDRSVSYAEFDRRVTAAAGIFQELGVAPGDRVAVLCRNRIAFFELLFACGKLGAILVPLNWRMPTAEILPLIADSEPKVLFYGREDETNAARVSNCVSRTVGLDETDKDGYKALLAAAPTPSGLRAQWPGDEIWYLIYTSGTTGAPKAVIYTYGMALANYVNLRGAVDLRDGDRSVNYLPLFHTAGINLHTLPILMAGGQVNIISGFDVDRIVDLLVNSALDAFFAVPTIYQQLSEHPRLGEADLTRVRSWGCGGAPLADVVVEHFARQGALVCNGYGMTETGPTCFLMSPDWVTRKVGSVGKPQLLVSAKIADLDGHEVAVGETGEMWISGPAVTPGYWKRPDATKAAFSDRWLRSGDLARRDADGFHYIVGRTKDMFISGAENVYPSEIETVLVKHPNILEAAVIGIPDTRWGEVGRAYVLLRQTGATDVEELKRFCRERLAAYKCPKEFVIVPEFPRTSVGKIQKHKLAALA
ncbi:MAG: AMP-binding protein [Alphaproteobacteria bacterium]|nr:AMP-binding protein [Alphaproteobacteria bacterium]MDE2110122.1 AMP-binding protein [Alphaproteobacteria bacterium]MDE2492759.1 AMP-binding protein [Alphaproteobacteria bacterium]